MESTTRSTACMKGLHAISLHACPAQQSQACSLKAMHGRLTQAAFELLCSHWHGIEVGSLKGAHMASGSLRMLSTSS